jgi:hypothetical protein
MPKKFLATAITIALVVTMLSVIPISKANFYPIPSLQIMGHNPSYPNGSNYTFTVEVHISMDAPAIISISYSLDGETNITSTNLTYTTWFPSNLPNNHQIYSISKNLYDLSDGNHTLKVYSFDAKGGVMSETWTFTVDRNFDLPAIKMISPLNQSYNKNKIPLTYTIDVQTAQIKWAYFTLDSIGSESYRGDNFNGNITLSNLTDGPHSIKLEVLTEKGISKQVTYFNIDTTAQTGDTETPTSTSQSMPTINTGPTLPVELNPPIVYIILAVVIVIVAVASISLVYFRRRKGKP